MPRPAQKQAEVAVGKTKKGNTGAVESLPVVEDLRAHETLAPRTEVEDVVKATREATKVLGDADLMAIASGSVVLSGAAVSRCSAAIQTLHEATWSGSIRLADSERKMLEGVLGAAIPVFVRILGAVEATDPVKVAGISDKPDEKPAKRRNVRKAAADGDGTEDGMAVECPAVLCVRSLIVALDVAAMYLTFVTVYGLGNAVYVDEANEVVISLLRSQFRSLLPHLFDDPDERKKKFAGGAGNMCLANMVGGSLRQQVAQRCSSVLVRMHAYTSRVRLADHQIHHLVFLSVQVLFLGDPVPQLSLAAIDLVANLFARFEEFRSSIIQECMAMVVKVPIGRKAKRDTLLFDGMRFSTFSVLILKLLQSCCTPMYSSQGPGTDPTVPELSEILARRQSLKQCMQKIGAGIVERCVLRSEKDGDARHVIAIIVNDLQQALSQPRWVAAPDLLTALLALLLNGVIATKKPLDASAREFALRLLGDLGRKLFADSAEVTRYPLAIPDRGAKVEAGTSCLCGSSNGDLSIVCHDCSRGFHADCVGLEGAKPKHWYCDMCALRRIAGKLKESAGSKAGAADVQLSQDLVFKYLIMSHINGCTGSTGVSTLMPPRNPDEPSSAMAAEDSVFSSEHPIHSRSYVIGLWAEQFLEAQRIASQAVEKEADVEDTKEDQEDLPKTGKRRGRTNDPAAKPAKEKEPERYTSQERMLIEFLNSEYSSGLDKTSRCPALISKYCVLRLYRQLVSEAMTAARKAVLTALVTNTASAMATLRKSAMRSLGIVIEADVNLVREPSVEYVIQVRSLDDSALVRQMSLDLLGRLLARTQEAEDEDKGDEADENEEADRSGPNAALAAEILPGFIKVVRGRVADTSMMVRRKAIWILSRILVQQPADHPDVMPTCVELMKRVNDSEMIKKVVLDTFEKIFFSEARDAEPTENRAMQFAKLVDAAARFVNQKDFVEDLLLRYKKSLNSGDKLFLESLRLWVRVLFDSFSTLTDGDDTSRALRGAIMSTLVAISDVQPHALLDHLRPMAMYLKLDSVAPEADRWVALRVLNILKSVIPIYKAARADRRLCTSMENELLNIITRQGSLLVHGAVQCLCLVVQHWTMHTQHICKLLNDSIAPAQGILQTAVSGGSVDNPAEIRFLCRAIYIMCSVVENVDLGAWIASAVQPADDSEPAPSLPREALRFTVKDDVATTVAVLLEGLFSLGNPVIEGTILPCMGFFLANNRAHVKTKRMQTLVQQGLKSARRDHVLKTLVMMGDLMTRFEHAALTETTWNSQQGLEADQSSGPSASESAAPLAVNHLNQILAVLTGTLDASQSQVHCDSQLRLAALKVLEAMDTQGLVNPYQIIPAVFSMLWYGDKIIENVAGKFIHKLLDLRPQLFLNRLDQSLVSAFGVLLQRFPGELAPGRQLPAGVSGGLCGIADLYAERFRKSKPNREKFLSCLLKELSQGGRSELFTERFPHLAKGKKAKFSKEGKVVAGSEKLSSLDFHRLLYTQFVSAVVMALPFQFESEPLWTIYNCDRFVDLHADATVSKVEEASKGNRGQISELGEEEDVFHICIATSAMRVIKSCLRAEYRLDEDRCQTYEPNEQKQEKAKFGLLVGDNDGGAETEKTKFNVDVYGELCEPFVVHSGDVKAMGKELGKLLSDNPWSSNTNRYLQILNKVEAGKGGRKGRGKGKGRGRGRASADPEEEVVLPTADAESSEDEEEDPEPPAKVFKASASSRRR